MKDRRGVSAQLNSSANSAATQPVNEARSLKRNQQIRALHIEFEDLKRKIKDVQSKNEQIRENFQRQQHPDFKKKPNFDNTTPVGQYDRRHNTFTGQHQASSQEHKQAERPSSAMQKNSKIRKNVQHSTFYQGQRSSLQKFRDEDSVQEPSSSHQLHHPPPIQSNLYVFSPASQYLIPSHEEIPVSQFNGVSSSPYPYCLPFPTYPPPLAVSKVGQSTLQLQEALKKQKQKVKILQQELSQRQDGANAYKKLLKRYNNMAQNCTQVVELCLQDFFQDVVKRRMNQIDKCVKKNENRLKKLHLGLKDRKQETRSRRLIQEHRTHRSHSRNRRQFSPKVPSNLNNHPRLTARHTTYEPPHDTTKSKLSQLSRPSQFQEIAGQYQQIIHVKTRELQQSQIRLRQKENQLAQISAKCAKLQKRAHDFADIPKTKSRKNSEKQDNLLANLVFQNDNDLQILQLHKKIAELEQIIQTKEKDVSAKDLALDKGKLKIQEYEGNIKKIESQNTKLKQQLKRFERQISNDSTLKATMKKLQNDLQLKQEQFQQLRQKYTRIQSEKVKKQCQSLSLNNKLKKLEGMLQLRDDKVAQLQKIIQSNVSGESNDLLQHSLYIGPDQQDLQTLQEEKDRLEQQLLRQRELIFQLQKDKESLNCKFAQAYNSKEELEKEVQILIIQNENMRLSLRSQQFEKYRTEFQASPLKKLLEEGDCLSEEEEGQLRSEFEQLKSKYEDLQGQLKVQNQKTFEQNRKALKIASQLSYFREQLADRQARYQKLRKEQEEGRGQITSLLQTIQLREGELQIERKINADKIKQIEAQWHQFEQEIRQAQQEERLQTSQGVNQSHSELKKSRHILQSSFLSYRQAITGSNNTNAQLEKAQDKLKQAEKMIQVQKEMEQRIINQYKGNVDRLKAEIRDKAKILEKINEQNELLKRKVRALELSKNRSKNQGKDSFEGPTQKLIDLQAELTQIHEINDKRQSLQQQLYSQISQIQEKDQQIQRLTQLVQTKTRKIEQLQDLLQLKEVNLNSHISVIPPKKMRDSMQSHCSLRYSILSNNPVNINKDKTMELDLSQVGESYLDQNQSILSNVSEVFGRQEFPYQKMHLKRLEQRRLFQKTAAYIKSLKKAIEQKNRKIKLFQKKIQSLRSSELIRKDIYNVIPKEIDDDLQPQSEDIFKDYYSVQQESSHSHRYRLKQLQHETKLTIQQNNLLSNQIQSIQDELTKAEEQEDHLMKLKDLYKEQIKNLIRQNQDQLKLFEQEMKKQRQKVEQSQSLQRMQALRQIFLKVVNAFLVLQQDSKSKKRQQRKKELEDYLKVCCNLMNIDAQIRDKILSDIRQMKR